MHSNFVGRNDSFDLNDPRFQTALEFLKRKDLETLEDQTIMLEHGVKAMIQSYKTVEASEKQFEAHDRFYDIQYVISGRECMYVCDRSTLSAAVPYNPEKDIVFFNEPESCDCIVAQTGKYIFFDKTDAHKPGCTYKETMNIRKVVIKIPVA